METRINLSEKSAISLRKSIGILSLILSVVIMIIIVFGGIPIFKQGSNLIKMIYNLFEIFNITSEPILFCLLRFGFAALYFTLLVFIVKDFITMTKTVKKWSKDEHDTKRARLSVSICLGMYNDIFVKFIIIAASSYVLDSYKLSIGANLVFALLVLIHFALNSMKVILVKRHLADSIFAPLISTFVLIVAAMFMFNSLDFELDLYVRQLLNFFSMVFTLMGSVSWGLILKTLMTQVFLPAFGVYVIVRLILLFIASMSHGMKFVNFEKNCKIFMITNLIVFGATTVVLMVSEGTFVPSRLIDLLVGNLEYALLGVALFVISKNQGSSVPNAPAYDDLIQEEIQQLQDDFVVDNPQ